MTRFNHHFANHFGGCQLLFTGQDPHRGREVQVRLIPGEWDVVGLTDGTDAWVAPVNAIGSPLLARAKMIMDEIRAGKPPRTAATRRKLLLDDDPQPEPSARPRTRLTIPLDDEVPTPRRKLNV